MSNDPLAALLAPFIAQIGQVHERAVRAELERDAARDHAAALEQEMQKIRGAVTPAHQAESLRPRSLWDRLRRQK